LTEVQAISRGELKASVLGAYERGERAISITRLQRLASLYRVPVAALLPGAPVVAGEGGQLDIPVVFDLARLQVAGGPEVEVLRHYLAQLQVERGDLNGRVLSVRAEDLRAVAWVLGMDEAVLRARLIELGILSTGHHA
jgi:transcriptional regulator with XRE-family HTH domain